MRSRISIRGCVRPSVRQSVRRSVGHTQVRLVALCKGAQCKSAQCQLEQHPLLKVQYTLWKWALTISYIP